MCVRLLGGVELRLGGQQVAPLDSARAESLLACLLLRRDAPQQRRHLAFTLWPDSTESQARTNLRHVLHNLRRGLPDADRFIDAGPRTLQWRPDAPLWLDVAALEEALEAGRLEEAVDLYKGDLLEGHYDEWLLEERERLAQLHLHALERLVKELEERDRLTEAIGYAERLLREDSLREETYRALIRLYDASGDRGRALRAYHACATTLVRELGVEPSARIRAAYEALLEPAEPSTETAPRLPARSPLVGRGAERARLAELWREGEGGRAQLVLVTGEAGIGKSRLVEELRSCCAHRGAAIAESRSYAAEGAMAYGALVAWLRADPIHDRLPRLDPPYLTELARLLPELRGEMPELAAPEPLPEDEQRQRLFTAAARAILATGAPLLLVAEDLHWCDVQTLSFLHYLLRTQAEAPLLVAATARPEELEADEPVRESVAALAALGVVAEIELERLNHEETVILAERTADRRLAEGEAERIREESEGVPLFLVEALRAEPSVATPPGDMSDRVRAVTTSRLARLDEPAKELVGVAATIGREFTVPVLADASGASDRTLVRGLDELWRRAIVRARGPNAYDFTHGKIREAAYAALSPAQARAHHLRVAKALTRSHSGDNDAASGQIAAHYEAAGAIEEAIAWSMRAADAAQRLRASADAVRSLERGLRLARELPPIRERDALELGLLTQLPAPLVAVEGYLSERVAQVHARALALARSLGVDPEPPLARSLAMATLTRGEFEAARPFGEQLRARADRDRDDILWVESAYVLGVSAYWLGRLEKAREEFEAALERYRPEHRAAHLVRYGQDPEVFCRMRLAHTLWLLGRADEAERARDEALAAAGTMGHPYTRAATLVFAVLLALDQGDLERLRSYASELCSDRALLEAGATRSGAQAFAGYVDVLDGRRDEGVKRVRDAVAKARDAGPAAPGHLGLLARVLVDALAAAGEPEAGLAAADDALETGGGAQLWEAEIRRLRAGLLAAAGAKLREVEAELRRAIEVAGRQGARPFALRARSDLERLPVQTR